MNSSSPLSFCWQDFRMWRRPHVQEKGMPWVVHLSLQVDPVGLWSLESPTHLSRLTPWASGPWSHPPVSPGWPCGPLVLGVTHPSLQADPVGLWSLESPTHFSRLTAWACCPWSHPPVSPGWPCGPLVLGVTHPSLQADRVGPLSLESPTLLSRLTLWASGPWSHPPISPGWHRGPLILGVSQADWFSPHPLPGQDTILFMKETQCPELC